MGQSRVGRKTSRRLAVKARKSLPRGRGTKAFARRATVKTRTRVMFGKTRAQPHRHVASPATAREIAQSLDLTVKDLAAGSALVDRLGL